MYEDSIPRCNLGVKVSRETTGTKMNFLPFTVVPWTASFELHRSMYMWMFLNHRLGESSEAQPLDTEGQLPLFKSLGRPWMLVPVGVQNQHPVDTEGRLYFVSQLCDTLGVSCLLGFTCDPLLCLVEELSHKVSSAVGRDAVRRPAPRCHSVCCHLRGFHWTRCLYLVFLRKEPVKNLSCAWSSSQ